VVGSIEWARAIFLNVFRGRVYVFMLIFILYIFV